MRSTHTYVTMDVSARAYAEIRQKMLEASYEHAVHRDGEKELIDMHGLAIKSKARPAPGGELMVGLTEKGDEVVINHPDLVTDAEGNGFITFSPAQARRLAELLLKHARAAEGIF